VGKMENTQNLGGLTAQEPWTHQQPAAAGFFSHASCTI